MSALPVENEVALTGGRWVLRGLVWHWEPSHARLALVVVEDRAPEPPPAVIGAAVDLGQLVACPRCGAKVTQRCRQPNGKGINSHAGRLAPRLCPCGELPARGATYCKACGRESRARSRREYEERRAS